MHTPTAPGAQPCPCACHTACRMHLRTPSRLRSARPRWSRLHGTEYWMFLFSQPPPLRISLTSISSCSHCSKRIDGIGPQLAQARGLGDSVLDRLPDPDLIHAHRRVDHERRHTGVLADGA